MDLQQFYSEMVIHPLVGSACVGSLSIGGRKNVFDAFPGGYSGFAGNYLRATSDFDCLIACHRNDDWPVEEKTKAKIHMLGKGCWKREVREILGSDNVSGEIRCGETVNRPGGWSSWPPHRFDQEGAPNFQEVFYVFTDPKDGYGIMRINGELREVRSGDRIDVPLGEHPIVAGPGVRLMYVWFFVGAEKLYPKRAEDLGAYA